MQKAGSKIFDTVKGNTIRYLCCSFYPSCLRIHSFWFPITCGLMCTSAKLQTNLRVSHVYSNVKMLESTLFKKKLLYTPCEINIQTNFLTKLCHQILHKFSTKLQHPTGNLVQNLTSSNLEAGRLLSFFLNLPGRLLSVPLVLGPSPSKGFSC